MNDSLRDRILRKLEQMSDERGYQVLDFVEFMESKYATRSEPAANLFTRFAEGVEDKLRAGKVSASTIAETMSLMNRAVGVLNGVAAAGKSVVDDMAGVAQRAASAAAPNSPSSGTSTPPTSPPAGAPPSPGATPAGTNPPPGDQRQ